jgi:DNA-binding transcriptional LysR family regulator
MWRLLEQRNLLSFMPKSVAQPFLQAGLLTEIALPRNIPIASIGMVARSDAQENAAAVLADFLRKRFAKQARDAGPRHSAE